MAKQKKYATVDPINPKAGWSAHAALGDALSRCPTDAKLMIVWVDKDDTLHFSQACDNAMAVYMMNACIHKVTFDP